MGFGYISLGICVLAGLAFAASLQHGLNALRSKEREDWVYSAGSLSLFFTLLLGLAYNNAADADAYRRYYQWHALVSRPFFFAWAYFILRFSGFSSPWPYRIWLGAEALKALLLLAFISTPYFFDVQSLGRQVQPWGEAVAYPIGQAHPLQFIQLLLPLISMAYTGAGAWRLWRRGQGVRAGALLVLIGSGCLTVFYDNLADVLGWPDVALAEFFIVVPIAFLAWTSSERLLEVVQMRLDLARTRGELARSRQMRLLGELSSGLAHDFRNLLSAVKLSAQSLRDALPGVAKAPELDDMEQAVELGRALTQRLLALGRDLAPQPARLDAAEQLEAAAALLRPSLGPGHVLRVEAPAGLHLWADPVLVVSALLNLGLNARDAMSEGGLLRLEAAPAPGPDGLAGVALRVVDQGPGMDAEQQRRIFEPFYTTKGPGKGTGLGLAMALHAAQCQGGQLTVQSAPGQGARFQLWLPGPLGGASPA